MYDRCHRGRGALKESFVLGVVEFITQACEQDRYHNDGGVQCPCSKCDCTKILEERVMKVHLYKHGFKPNYWIWTDHGEQIQEGHFNNDDNCMGHFNYVDEDIVHDALRHEEPFKLLNSYNMNEAPNEETQRFYNLLLDANMSLYEGASDSKLSMCVRLLACKSNWNVPDKCLEFISNTLLDATPIKTCLPKSYYDAKKLVLKLGLDSKKINCCMEACTIFYDNQYKKNDGALLECKFCQTPRYRHKVDVLFATNSKVTKNVCLNTNYRMIWHYKKKSTNGVLHHPCDGEPWKKFDRAYPNFSTKAHNVRLGLCFDGFNPYVQASNIPYVGQ